MTRSGTRRGTGSLRASRPAADKSAPTDTEHGADRLVEPEPVAPHGCAEPERKAERGSDGPLVAQVGEEADDFTSEVGPQRLCVDCGSQLWHPCSESPGLARVPSVARGCITVVDAHTYQERDKPAVRP